MPVIPITSMDDPRVGHYRDLTDRELAAAPTEEGMRGRFFIAEGEHLVRRLLASNFQVESLLLAERRVVEIAPLAPPDVPVFAVSDEVMTAVMGFKFHSGVIAVGRRKIGVTLDSVMPPRDAPPGTATKPITLLIAPEVINHDNLGSLIRIAAAFGVDALLLGERSCDPFWRRSVRVSMGTIFSLPIYHSPDLLHDLRRLQSQWGVTLAATVLDADAQPLETVKHPGRLALLLGSESQGLQPRWVRACDLKLTLPMHHGTDSLNVSIAAAVFLYHFTRVKPVRKRS